MLFAADLDGARESIPTTIRSARPIEMSSVAGVLPENSLNRHVMVAFLALWALSCVRLPYPKYFAMQHVPTVLAVVALTMAEKKQLVDRPGFALVIAFMVLHLLGARYLYSFVPYDAWSQSLFGFRITDYFGFERNHYDRLVHFCFGILIVYPIWRFSERQLHLRGWWVAGLAVSMVMAASAVYEIGEWATAMTFAPEWAEAYNGQQGDVWDAQRDMALAGIGAILGAGAVSLFHKSRKRVA
jgi:putative membrane protein